jgi:hypothetical protein
MIMAVSQMKAMMPRVTEHARVALDTQPIAFDDGDIRYYL